VQQKAPADMVFAVCYWFCCV